MVSKNQVEQHISHHSETRQTLQRFVRYETRSHHFPALQREMCCLGNFDIAFPGTYSKQVT